MSNSGYLDMMYCHPHPELRQRLFSGHFMSANLADQHGFRPVHSTTSALLQLTSDVATGCNQRKLPHRTSCVAVDLTEAFDTVNHSVDVKHCKINAFGGNISMAVELYQRQTISYKLQRRQVEGNDIS